MIRKTFFVSFPLCLLLAETSISPSSNLHTEGVPPIPTVLMEELDHYNDIRGASLLDWHPAKSEVLISTRFADVPQIHRVAMPGGARTQLTFFPDRTGSAQYRPGAGESFAFSKDTGGGEFYQLFRFDTRSSAITLLTDGQVLVYAIGIDDDDDDPLVLRRTRYHIYHYMLGRLTSISGGRAFRLFSGRNYSLNSLAQVLLEELHQQYTLSYYPASDRDKTSWRQIAVKVKKPGSQIRAREGYYVNQASKNSN